MKKLKREKFRDSHKPFVPWWIDDDKDYALIKSRPDLMMSICSHRVIGVETGEIKDKTNAGRTEYIYDSGMKLPVFQLFCECFKAKNWESSYVRAKDKDTSNITTENISWARYMIHDFAFMCTIFERVNTGPIPSFRIRETKEDFQCSAWHLGFLLGIREETVIEELSTFIGEFKEGYDWWEGSVLALHKGKVVDVGRTTIYGYSVLERYIQYNSMVDYRNTSLMILLDK